MPPSYRLPENRRDFFWLAPDRKSTRLNSSHVRISYAVFCLKKKKKKPRPSAVGRILIADGLDLPRNIRAVEGSCRSLHSKSCCMIVMSCCGIELSWWRHDVM